MGSFRRFNIPTVAKWSNETHPFRKRDINMKDTWHTGLTNRQTVALWTIDSQFWLMFQWTQARCDWSITGSQTGPSVTKYPPFLASALSLLTPGHKHHDHPPPGHQACQINGKSAPCQIIEILKMRSPTPDTRPYWYWHIKEIFCFVVLLHDIHIFEMKYIWLNF